MKLIQRQTVQFLLKQFLNNYLSVTLTDHERVLVVNKIYWPGNLFGNESIIPCEINPQPSS